MVAAVVVTVVVIIALHQIYDPTLSPTLPYIINLNFLKYIIKGTCKLPNQSKILTKLNWLNELSDYFLWYHYQIIGIESRQDNN